MDAQTILFYIFALITVFAALRVVTARSAVHAVLHLVLTFVSAACIWMLMKAEFLAIVLVLVYVGAVMVLFLFVVMMLDLKIDATRQGFWGNLPVASLVGVVIVLELSAVIVHSFSGVKGSDAPRLPEGFSNTEALGRLIYTDFVYPFEIAGVILLIAMVAAIALTLRKRKDTRYNDPSVAVRTKAADRLKMIKMPSVNSADTTDKP